ncbi:RNA-directed DNA polymerase [Burkholderia cenocepacia]|nr:RNA-directed DNA polymerase [Burkholderia cenocepacia]RQV79236.1 RNA-directed DNA polymerase [Burkholderia cenocepacia]
MKQLHILNRMARDLGMLPSQLATLIRTAPLRYKTFTIKKRDGKDRHVAQPAREIKTIQRWLIEDLRQNLPIHPSVMAYEPGTSIKENAERHVKSNFLLKMDFTNFFPSISAIDIENHLEKHCPTAYDLSERKIISRACTWLPERSASLQLCIGAPSSPLISNSIMHEFDYIIGERAETDQVTYTRYADDLTFSCNEKGILSNYVDFVSETLKNLTYPRISVNNNKTVHASRACNRVVTGITLTPDGNLSIGRERKREIRAMYHRSTKGLLNDEQLQILNGLLAFIENIEPGFSKKLKQR